jgi:hypothetical protein
MEAFDLEQIRNDLVTLHSADEWILGGSSFMAAYKLPVSLNLEEMVPSLHMRCCGML